MRHPFRLRPAIPVLALAMGLAAGAVGPGGGAASAAPAGPVVCYGAVSDPRLVGHLRFDVRTDASVQCSEPMAEIGLHVVLELFDGIETERSFTGYQTSELHGGVTRRCVLGWYQARMSFHARPFSGPGTSGFNYSNWILIDYCGVDTFSSSEGGSPSTQTRAPLV